MIFFGNTILEIYINIIWFLKNYFFIIFLLLEILNFELGPKHGITKAKTKEEE